MSAAPPPVADILLRIVERRREVVGLSAAGPHPPTPLSLTPLRGQAGEGGLNRESLPVSPPLLSGRGGLGGEVAQPNPFLAALTAHRGRAIIAEVKMGSPRLGSLAGRVDPLAQARAYAAGGAVALSVVVEPDFFHGSYELLAACQAASGLPAIAKDFIVDAVQIRWAREAGADAVLLIAALHTGEQLRGYADQARALGLVPLIETHGAADLDKLEGADWELIGVNNRDLRTFQVNLENSIELLPRLPASAVRVAESAIRSRADMRRLRDAGFDAFLIGESLLLAEDPVAKLREFLDDD